MSAYMVDDAVLIALAVESARASYVHPLDLREAVHSRYCTLHRQNVDSLRYRYPSDWQTMVTPPLDTSTEIPLNALSRTYNPISIAKAVLEYDYQACEVPGYESTEAALIAHRALTGAIRRLPGHDDAPRIGR